VKLHTTLRHAADEAQNMHDTIARLVMSEGRLREVVDALPRCDVLNCKRIATRHVGSDERYCVDHCRSGSKLPGLGFEEAVQRLEEPVR
jgi:hypothetical protein